MDGDLSTFLSSFFDEPVAEDDDLVLEMLQGTEIVGAQNNGITEIRNEPLVDEAVIAENQTGQIEYQMRLGEPPSDLEDIYGCIQGELEDIQPGTIAMTLEQYREYDEAIDIRDNQMRVNTGLEERDEHIGETGDITNAILSIPDGLSQGIEDALRKEQEHLTEVDTGRIWPAAYHEYDANLEEPRIDSQTECTTDLEDKETIFGSFEEYFKRCVYQEELERREREASDTTNYWKTIYDDDNLGSDLLHKHDVVSESNVQEPNKLEMSVMQFGDPGTRARDSDDIDSDIIGIREPLTKRLKITPTASAIVKKQLYGIQINPIKRKALKGDKPVIETDKYEREVSNPELSDSEQSESEDSELHAFRQELLSREVPEPIINELVEFNKTRHIMLQKRGKLKRDEIAQKNKIKESSRIISNLKRKLDAARIVSKNPIDDNKIHKLDKKILDLEREVAHGLKQLKELGKQATQDNYRSHFEKHQTRLRKLFDAQFGIEPPASIIHEHMNYQTSINEEKNKVNETWLDHKMQDEKDQAAHDRKVGILTNKLKMAKKKCLQHRTERKHSDLAITLTKEIQDLDKSNKKRQIQVAARNKGVTSKHYSYLDINRKKHFRKVLALWKEYYEITGMLAKRDQIYDSIKRPSKRPAEVNPNQMENEQNPVKRRNTRRHNFAVNSADDNAEGQNKEQASHSTSKVDLPVSRHRGGLRGKSDIKSSDEQLQWDQLQMNPTQQDEIEEMTESETDINDVETSDSASSKRDDPVFHIYQQELLSKGLPEPIIKELVEHCKHVNKVKRSIEELTNTEISLYNEIKEKNGNIISRLKSNLHKARTNTNSPKNDDRIQKLNQTILDMERQESERTKQLTKTIRRARHNYYRRMAGLRSSHSTRFNKLVDAQPNIHTPELIAKAQNYYQTISKKETSKFILAKDALNMQADEDQTEHDRQIDILRGKLKKSLIKCLQHDTVREYTELAINLTKEMEGLEKSNNDRKIEIMKKMKLMNVDHKRCKDHIRRTRHKKLLKLWKTHYKIRDPVERHPYLALEHTDGQIKSQATGKSNQIENEQKPVENNAKRYAIETEHGEGLSEDHISKTKLKGIGLPTHSDVKVAITNTKYKGHAAKNPGARRKKCKKENQESKIDELVCNLKRVAATNRRSTRVSFRSTESQQKNQQKKMKMAAILSAAQQKREQQEQRRKDVEQKKADQGRYMENKRRPAERTEEKKRKESERKRQKQRIEKSRDEDRKRQIEKQKGAEEASKRQKERRKRDVEHGRQIQRQKKDGEDRTEQTERQNRDKEDKLSKKWKVVNTEYTMKYCNTKQTDEDDKDEGKSKRMSL